MGPLSFDPSIIDCIEVAAMGAPEMVLEKDGFRWWVREPFEDHAAPEKIEALFAGLTQIVWAERVERDEFDAAAWERTGLDDTRLSIVLKSGGSEVAGCVFGMAAVLDGSVYLKIPSASGAGFAYYVAKTNLPSMFQSGAAEWRDSKLLRLPEESIKRVILSPASGQIELARDSARAPWGLVKPLVTRGDNDRIGEVVSTLLNLTIKDVAETPASEGSAVALESLKVAVVVEGRAEPLEATLSKPAAGAQTTVATTTGRKPVFTVESPSLMTLWAMPNDLRDPMLARVRESDVTRIQISSTTNPTVIMVKEKGAWMLERQGGMVPANGERLASLFDALNGHKIVEFAADSASNLESFGLDDPFLSLEWDEGGKKPVKLIFGANADRTGFFAKYEADPFVYRIGASLLPAVPSDPVKWMGLGVLRFTQFALRGITIAAGAQSPLELRYNPETAEWTAARAGRDISPMIDRVRADALANKLARLTAEDWAGDRSAGYEALEDPWLTLVVELGEPGVATGPAATTTIRFAPTVKDRETAFFYGRVNDDPDVFYISRQGLLEVLTSVFKDGASVEKGGGE